MKSRRGLVTGHSREVQHVVEHDARLDELLAALLRLLLLALRLVLGLLLARTLDEAEQLLALEEFHLIC